MIMDTCLTSKLLAQVAAGGFLLLTLFIATPPTPILATSSHTTSKVNGYEPVNVPCTSEIYCHGPLLDTIQRSGMYPDSKTFVDMPTRHTPEVVIENFLKLPSNATLDELRDFIAENFYPAGSDMVEWTPNDWVAEPDFLKEISNPNLRVFAQSIHARWRNLGRTFNQSSCGACYSSFILPYPFIVPGGRFREAYYWDTYWIIDGLLVSGMVDTVHGMIRNFFFLIDHLGFVPNGGRVYYSARSQPPLLTRMVNLLYEHTKDQAFLIEALPYLDREYTFWMRERSVQVKSPHSDRVHTVNVFSVATNVPRPESYLEDIELAEELPESERSELYSQLASGAETGWDYSSRWFKARDTFSTIETKNVVPVDLNSILYDMERLLAKYHKILNGTEMEQYYTERAEERLVAIHDLFWNASATTWYDFNLRTGMQHPGFYLSNVMPIWAEAYRVDWIGEGALEKISEDLAKEVSQYHLCGLPTSKIDTEQQWDYPNSWAPLQYFAVEALRRLPNGSATASFLSHAWVSCNYCGWIVTGGTDDGAMYEKYDAEMRGIPGGGGEYGVQEGFGWTNGVALRFIVDNARDLVLLDCSPSAKE